MGGTSDLSLSSVAIADAPGGLCRQATGTIYKGINAIFNALHIERVDMPKTGVAFLDGLIQGLADLVVDGINFVVEAGRKLIIGIYEYTIGKVLSIVAKVAALAAVIAQFAILLSPMRVNIVTDRETVPKGITPDLEHVVATAKAQIDIAGTGPGEWPEIVVDCAQVAGVTLPPLKPIGDPVEWSIHSSEPGLLVEDDNAKKETVLKDGGPGTAIAKLPMVTAQEAEAKGEQVSRTAFVHAKVSRKQVSDLRDLVLTMGARLITDELPRVIGRYLHDAIVGVGKDLTEGLAKTVFSATGLTAVEVTFHEPEKDKPKPTTVRGERWQGTWSSEVYPISGTFTWNLTRRGTSVGGTLSVSGSDRIQGGHIEARIDGNAVEFGLVQGGRALISFSGTTDGRKMSGTYTSGPDCGSDRGPFQGTRSR